MANQYWRGTAIKRHFSSWGAGRLSKSWNAARVSRRMDQAVAEEARHSDYPDVGIYDRPATTRATPANLGLSIVLLLVALVVLGVILWTVFR